MDWVWGLGGGICGWLLRGHWLALAELAAQAHACAFAAYWRWRSRRPPGRPRIDPALIALIRRMARENPLWGAPRIDGELLRLGFTLAQSTVSKYLPQRRGGPSQDWATFLRNHASAIAAVDMFTAPTLLFGRASTPSWCCCMTAGASCMSRSPTTQMPLAGPRDRGRVRARAPPRFPCPRQ